MATPSKSDQHKSDQFRTSINKEAASPKHQQSEAKSDAAKKLDLADDKKSAKKATVVPLAEDSIAQPKEDAENKQAHIEEEAKKGESMTSDLTRKTQGEGLEG